MTMLPTHCDLCARSTLLDERTILDGLALCKTCAAPLRTLPGESYTANDIAIFEQVESTLHEAGISPLNATQLAAELEVRSGTMPGRALRRLVLALPSLGLLEVLVAQEPACLRKVEGIVATLLEALANGRSQSGFMPTPSRHFHFRSGKAWGS